ncbi:unnamed protein product [Didymodactylos carnosus]|uniref:EGF-like domain-containing protein n=1 Tax=Didymodactylos carnosus TaxID=1234261 RepID=A0A815JG34_9BILA|nr:unnamed protein product [Didymodactylos carnosus]CAF4277163.1 unnamed protein product [Didymodactylos carnosus]
MIKCICPLGKLGKNCFASFNSCKEISCLHADKCITLDLKGYKYVCICSNEYYGNLCQYRVARALINIKNLFHNNLIHSVPVVVIYFVNVYNNMGVTLLIQDILVYRNVPFNQILLNFYEKYLFITIYICSNIF